MKKFVTVFMGSRGILEEVNIVETELSLLEYSQNLVDDVYNEIDVDDDDYEEEVEMLSEFVTITECEGFNMVGLNEEEYMIVIDSEVNEDLCEKILECYNEDDEDGVRDLIENLEF